MPTWASNVFVQNLAHQGNNRFTCRMGFAPNGTGWMPEFPINADGEYDYSIGPLGSSGFSATRSIFCNAIIGWVNRAAYSIWLGYPTSPSTPPAPAARYPRRSSRRGRRPEIRPAASGD